MDEDGGFRGQEREAGPDRLLPPRAARREAQTRVRIAEMEADPRLALGKRLRREDDDDGSRERNQQRARRPAGDRTAVELAELLGLSSQALASPSGNDDTRGRNQGRPTPSIAPLVSPSVAVDDPFPAPSRLRAKISVPARV